MILGTFFYKISPKSTVPTNPAELSKPDKDSDG